MKVTPVGKNFNKHKLGDVFELPDGTANMLIKARLLRAVEAEEISTRTGQLKRTYSRRDMQAQA